MTIMITRVLNKSSRTKIFDTFQAGNLKVVFDAKEVNEVKCSPVMVYHAHHCFSTLLASDKNY